MHLAHLASPVTVTSLPLTLSLARTVVLAASINAATLAIIVNVFFIICFCFSCFLTGTWDWTRPGGWRSTRRTVARDISFVKQGTLVETRAGQAGNERGIGNCRGERSAGTAASGAFGSGARLCAGARPGRSHHVLESHRGRTLRVEQGRGNRPGFS